jgi:uncharacterized protein (TIGR04255 family)
LQARRSYFVYRSARSGRDSRYSQSDRKISFALFDYKAFNGVRLFRQISFHWQGKYPGWDIFQPAFKLFWTKLLNATPEITSRRVGVRFINMVDEKTADQEVGHWLKPAADYPVGLLSSKVGFFYTMRRPLKLEHYVQLFVAEGETRASDGCKPLILDIDVQSEHLAREGTTSNKELLSLIEILHDEVGDIFESSITENYLNLLNKRVE